jgi:hypothetical protein
MQKFAYWRSKLPSPYRRASTIYAGVVALNALIAKREATHGGFSRHRDAAAVAAGTEIDAVVAIWLPEIRVGLRTKSRPSYK